MTELEITFGVPEDAKVHVTEILHKAFTDKFDKLFGRQSFDLITKHLRNDRTLVATEGGEVVGVAGLNFDGRDFLDVSFWKLLRKLKFGVLRLFFWSIIFFHRVREDELMLDVLAVTKDFRGKGVGTSLIRFILEFASSKGFRKAKLFVANTNVQAKKFYVKLGFEEIKIHEIPFPWNKMLPFRSTSEMTTKT